MTNILNPTRWWWWESYGNGGSITNSLKIPDDGGAISAGGDAGTVIRMDLDGGYLPLVFLHVSHKVNVTSAHNVVLKDLPHTHLQHMRKVVAESACQWFI